MAILYQSTRGLAPELDLRGVTLAGLATDGGLYVPKEWPQFLLSDIEAMQDKPYLQVAQQILKPFVSPAIPETVLGELLKKAYSSFNDPAVTPLKKLDDRRWILELFHGPTLAFKDVALQLLGHVFEYFLSQNNKRMTIIGATSGDTGSAAIAALAGRKKVDVFILYPNKGPSDIQRKQMTCVDAPNVHAVVIDGSFDDCQHIVKSLFNDAALRTKYNLSTVNSINWLRVLAQIVYYFVAASKTAGSKPVSFVVPTGNFGNVYAAYAAMKCGLPISKLAVASNSNDILTRFFNSGRMKTEGVQSTLSPSMDIQVSSNFERLLFDLCGRDGAKVRNFMDGMKSSGEFAVAPVQLATARQVFTAARVNDELTLQTIRDIHEQFGYLLDPHSAVGIAASELLARELPDPVICLACAHPAKFPETMLRAMGTAPSLPPELAQLLNKPERTNLLPPDMNAVEKFISERIAL